MPACMAHYQFGQDVLSLLGRDVKSFALTHKKEFDIGLQGPDIFFYYKPYQENKINAYGRALHSAPAIRMFAPIIKKVSTGASLSYLMGLICHYTLDSCCHPYINSRNRSIAHHMFMEAAYDRHIISKNGLVGLKNSCIPSQGLDYDAITSVWDSVTLSEVRHSIESQSLCTRLLNGINPFKLLEVLSSKRGVITPVTLPYRAPVIQDRHVYIINDYYGEAVSRCPGLITKAVCCIGSSKADCPEFKLNHDGE